LTHFLLDRLSRNSSLVDDRALNTMKQYGYGTVASVHAGQTTKGTQESNISRSSSSNSLHREKRQFLDVHMGVPQLYENIQVYLYFYYIHIFQLYFFYPFLFD